MMRMALSMRRLAAAVHVRHGVYDGPQEAMINVIAAVGVHTRRLRTVSLSASPRPRTEKAARTEETAYARLAMNMATVAQIENMDPEARAKKTEDMVQYLERQLMMKRVTAIETFARFPLLIANTHELLERKLEWLANQGIDDKALHTIVRRHPQILGRSEEALEWTKQWFLDHGVASSKIPFIFMVAPEVNSLAHENRTQKVAFLRDVGLDADQIRCVIEQFSNFMTFTVENMASKVEEVKSLGVTNDEVIKVVTRVPQFLALNMHSVHSKLQALDEMFGEGEAVRLWLSSPPLIIRNTEELRRTFEYLTKVVGMTPDRISQNVELIMRNVDRLVRPRFEYLTEIQSRDLEGVKWIRMGETKFVGRHPGYADFLARDFKP